MVLNSSLHFNVSHPQIVSGYCLYSTDSTFVFTAYTAFSVVLVLPLCVLVLYVGFQRRSTSAITSDVDHITYHMAVVEIIGMIGSFSHNVGKYVKQEPLVQFGYYTFSMLVPGQTLFHCVTCVERYMAAVFPVIYMGLRKTAGIRIRYLSIGCVWLLCVGWTGVMYAYFPDFPSWPFLLLYIVSFLVVSFCSVSVFRALSRSGPGGGAKDRLDQSKQRAVHIMVGIMGALSVRFFGLLICTVLYKLLVLSGSDACLVMKSAVWLCIPSSLVLPLLFLHKTGRLACFKCSPAEDIQLGESRGGKT